MTNTVKNKKLYSLVVVGLMAALVYAGNYLQIPIPNGTIITRIHLGNSMCLLAGLLFGRMRGGLSSGIGAMFFDLFNPAFVTSAPFTFINKFAMGFVAGHTAKRGDDSKSNIIVAAVLGQLTYIVLYLIKTFVGQIMLGEPMEVALKSTGINAVTSTVNAVISCIVAVPLYFALKKALAHSSVNMLIEEKSVKHDWFNPLTTGLTIFALAAAMLFGIDLANTNKEKKKLEAQKEAYEQQIDDLSYKIEYLSEQMNISIPERNEEETADG
ncbi:MAG: ECF transporter S component [Oscillospiraceae bacterium]|nr:ECF transporter S component [Oscillospiraceae bacterium]